jgi:hypothetical protein
VEAAEGWLGGRQATARKIRAALEKAGIEFIDENGGGQGSVCASAKGIKATQVTQSTAKPFAIL